MSTSSLSSDGLPCIRTRALTTALAGRSASHADKSVRHPKLSATQPGVQRAAMRRLVSVVPHTSSSASSIAPPTA